MVYVGIDWGERKIGTAFGDAETKIAFAGKAFENAPGVCELLKIYADEHDADVCVVGRSTHLVHGDNTGAIDAFAEKLQQVSDKKVVFIDEMHSTKEAQENMKEAGKKNISHVDDVESARVILQRFLDRLES